MYTDLDDLISNSKKSAEIARGIAVKQDLLGKKRSVIASILDKSEAFICKWRKIYDDHGVNGLISLHQGGKSRSMLREDDLPRIMAHIQSHEVFGPMELMGYLKESFGVEFKSMQSYYSLLHEAGMSWHKSQKANPRRDNKKVLERREALKKSSRSIENRSKIKKR